jgi:hypothetical protein
MRTWARGCFVIGMLIILGVLVGVFTPMTVHHGLVDCGTAISPRSKSDIESDISSDSIFDKGDCATKLEMRRLFGVIGGGIGSLLVIFAWKTDSTADAEERQLARR